MAPAGSLGSAEPTPGESTAPQTSGANTSHPSDGAPSSGAPAGGAPIPDSIMTDGAGGTGNAPSSSPDSGTVTHQPVAPAGSGGSGGQAPLLDRDDPAVHFIGRFDDAGEDGMLFEWSGSGMVAAFEGTTVSVTLNDSGENQFTVLLDGELLSTLVAQAGTHSYELAFDLPSGEHQVALYRRTEALFGTSAFLGFDFGSGHLLPPPAAAERRIEIVGDSISCGYGNEGDSAACSFSPDTENHYATYGAMAARTLAAEVVTIAWSGKGVVHNYDTDKVDPLPALYDRILPSRASGSIWTFPIEPHAVVINLGTNDFSTDDDPSPELFQARYVDFLAHLRDKYPNTFILCTVGPLLSGPDLEAARSGIAAAVATRRAAGETNLEVWEMNIGNENPGCDYHPSVSTHQLMADALVEQLRLNLGW